MKGLAWLGVPVALGIAAGAMAFALIPTRYRAVTTLQVKTANDRPVDIFKGLLDNVTQRALREDRMESLVQELDLYAQERATGRMADAMLDLRRGVSLSRRVESRSVERWMLAFEASSPIGAQRASARMASMIQTEVDGMNPHPEPDPVRDALVDQAVTQLEALEAKIKDWSGAHGGRPAPAAMTNAYDKLLADAFELVSGYRGSHDFDFEPIGLDVSIVGTAGSTRVSRGFLPFAGGGAAAGLIIGLFTMAPLIWSRR